MHTGDKQQIEALKELYNMLLRKKDKYVEDTLTKELTPRQYWHLDVGFRLLTLELKMVHSKIHYLEFGGELAMEQEPKPLSFYINKFATPTITEEQYYRELSEKTAFKLQLAKANSVIVKLQNKLKHQYMRLWRYDPNKGKLQGQTITITLPPTSQCKSA